MQIFELFSIFTHAPIVADYKSAFKRLPCRRFLVLVITFTGVASIFYHTSMMFGTPFARRAQFVDHIGAESLMISASALFPRFRREWHRTVVNLILLGGLVGFKSYADALYYSIPVSVILALAGIRWFYKYRQLWQALAVGALGIMLFFMEGDDDTLINQILHSGWHLCIFSAVYYIEEATSYEPDSLDCTCVLRVVKGIKIASDPDVIYQTMELLVQSKWAGSDGAKSALSRGCGARDLERGDLSSDDDDADGGSAAAGCRVTRVRLPGGRVVEYRMVNLFET
jgi:hypothetical protein